MLGSPMAHLSPRYWYVPGICPLVFNKVWWSVRSWAAGMPGWAMLIEQWGCGQPLVGFKLGVTS